MIAPCAQFHLQASHLDPAYAIAVPELIDGNRGGEPSCSYQHMQTTMAEQYTIRYVNLNEAFSFAHIAIMKEWTPWARTKNERLHHSTLGLYSVHQIMCRPFMQ
jgi:hypothetical protein